MATTQELADPRKESNLWRKYCGYLDLSLKEFMAVQEGLLKEQLELLPRSELGRKVLGEARPRSIEEFREKAPLTKYGDYLPYLIEKREDVLVEKPYLWMRTSGRSGYYTTKWLPFMKGQYDATGRSVVGGVIIGAANKKGNVNIKEGDTVLHTLAPPPYPTGAALGPALEQEFPLRFLPSLKAAEKMTFQQRASAGIGMAMKEGIQVIIGTPSVLLRVAEMICGEADAPRPKRNPKAMMQPALVGRMLGAMVRSKLARRPLYPKDLWHPKSIILGGTDTKLYADAVERYWGRRPIEVFASSETGALAYSNWDADLMSFCPDQAFMEFIPQAELAKSQADPAYRPKTLLLDELKPGIYELVASGLYGSPLVRYRVGDLFQIVSIRNEKLGIDHPQALFYARADDIIDMGGFAKISEKTVLMALADSGLPVIDWAVVREFSGDRPFLHLHVELKGNGQLGPKEVADIMDHSLGKIDQDYKDMKTMLKMQPLKVTLLLKGTFARYMAEAEAKGADLAHFKPHRMKPTAEQLDKLLAASGQGRASK